MGQFDRFAAVIVAAGYSSRMNQFKPLLPLGEITIIESTIDSFIKAGIKNVLVVIGHNADLIKPVLEKRKVKWVYNPNYDDGMYTSIKVGVDELDHNLDGFFMMPADIPFVKPETVVKLAEAFLESGKLVVYPVLNERRGHPPLISSKVRHDILSYDGTGGLKTLLNRYSDEAYHLMVDDEGILMDLDTTETYEALKNRTE
ncbi:MAG TPA: hypothetical protein DCS67_12185 [Clostridiales bacterium UBA8960]|nr:hypothetical protein [Clostridiales bacterium UBA8960]